MFTTDTARGITIFGGGIAQGAFMVIGGAAGNLSVPGIVTEDKILSVEACQFAAGVPTTIHDLTEEFTISADGIIRNSPVTGTNTTGMLLLVNMSFVSRD